MDRKMPNVSNLTEDQIEKAKDITSTDELLKFAADEKIDLTDEQLEFISGGTDDYYFEAAP